MTVEEIKTKYWMSVINEYLKINGLDLTEDQKLLVIDKILSSNAFWEGLSDLFGMTIEEIC